MAIAPASSFDRRIELRADAAKIADARRFVRDAFEWCGPDVVADLALIASELVTNAIEHGDGDGVLVEAGRDGRRAMLRVTSHGTPSDVPDPADWSPGARSATSGRGLGIVAKLADAVDVARTESSLTTTVACDA